MEKINARLSTAIEDVNFEHYKKNEVINFWCCDDLFFLILSYVGHV